MDKESKQYKLEDGFKTHEIRVWWSLLERLDFEIRWWINNIETKDLRYVPCVKNSLYEGSICENVQNEKNVSKNEFDSDLDMRKQIWEDFIFRIERCQKWSDENVLVTIRKERIGQF